MSRQLLLVAFAVACNIIGKLQVADAAVVHRTFVLGNLTISPMCKPQIITAVNGQMPGPTIEVTEGDRLVVDIINKSPYDMTIHWHGVYQQLSPWYDGPPMITQCPIRPGRSFKHNFTLTGQEGTLWWHAHSSYHRATVYGVLIIRPKSGIYPFKTQPHEEIPLIIGQWWNDNVMDVEKEAYLKGEEQPIISDGFTINGLPGDLYDYNCTMNHTFSINVVAGKTYMLRIVNAAVNSQHFFKVAGHKFTVVGADASYNTPYETDVIVITSGQSVDALMVADAAPANYYMAARTFFSGYGVVPIVIDDTITTAIVHYAGANETTFPAMPIMPHIADVVTGNRFYTELTGLKRPGSPTVPQEIDEEMFITINRGRQRCRPGQTKCKNFAVAASMNNISFELPTKMSLLEAFYRGVKGVYTTDFPDNPPVIFDYTNRTVANEPLVGLMWPEKGTKVKRLSYGARVQIVLQNTAIFGAGYHPLHLHGFNFFVIAQGIGNYYSSNVTFNLDNPMARNTIALPADGWVVIRLVADNPGVWYMHCHLESHVEPGMMMAFVVENGGTPESTIPPPPLDYPACH